MISQLPMFPRYRAGGQAYLTLKEAARALGRVHANPTHALTRRPGEAPKMERHAANAALLVKGTYERPTLLKEVRAVPRDVPASVRALYPRPGGTKEVAPDDLADLGIDAIARFLEREWDPSARHVMMHSSGYDTRLVAAILRQLAAKHGRSWLGEIAFCCFQPELHESHQLWYEMDWPNHTWEPVYPRAPAEDYYARCLDFQTVGRELSEAERFWGGPLLTQLSLTERGLLPEGARLQGVSGLFGDESIKWNRLHFGTVAWFLACWWFDNPGILPGRPECEFLTPFTSQDWLELLTEFHVPLTIDNFKILMMSRVDSTLANPATFPNWRYSARRVRQQNIAREAARRGVSPKTIEGFLDQQQISRATALKMEADYAASWYARTIGPPTLRFQDDRAFRYWDHRNTHYLKAAIYEHLRAQGVEVLT